MVATYGHTGSHPSHRGGHPSLRDESSMVPSQPVSVIAHRRRLARCAEAAQPRGSRLHGAGVGVPPLNAGHGQMTRMMPSQPGLLADCAGNADANAPLASALQRGAGLRRGLSVPRAARPGARRCPRKEE